MFTTKVSIVMSSLKFQLKEGKKAVWYKSLDLTIKPINNEERLVGAIKICKLEAYARSAGTQQLGT